VKFNLTFAPLGHENRENYDLTFAPLGQEKTISRHKYVLERICQGGIDPSMDGVATANLFFAALVTSVTSVTNTLGDA
jgi:hypothetical protein